MDSRVWIAINYFTEHISEWKSENRPAVWLHIPIFLGGLIPVASEQGFTIHHAKGEEIVMSRWLAEDRPDKIPNYASHQVGVCGESVVGCEISALHTTNFSAQPRDLSINY